MRWSVSAPPDQVRLRDGWHFLAHGPLQFVRQQGRGRLAMSEMGSEVVIRRGRPNGGYGADCVEKLARTPALDILPKIARNLIPTWEVF
jgi:hypothetical protein